jgi:hypothetical protein
MSHLLDRRTMTAAGLGFLVTACSTTAFPLTASEVALEMAAARDWWASKGYPTDRVPPFALVDQTYLRTITRAYSVHGQREVRGAYGFGTIFLWEELDFRHLSDRAVVMHEYGHHVHRLYDVAGDGIEEEAWVEEFERLWMEEHWG